MNTNPLFERLSAVAMIVLVAACGNLGGSASSPEWGRNPAQDEPWLKGVSAGNRTESLLHWFDHARRLSAAEWSREHEQLRQHFGADKSDFTRLRLGMLLAAPNAPAREQARAASVLEPLTRDANGRDPGLRALAQLVAADIAERRRLAEELQSATQQLQSTTQQLQSATQRQKEDAARATDLEQKLEALKAIEQNLQHRKQKIPPATGGGAKTAPARPPVVPAQTDSPSSAAKGSS